MPGDLPRAQTVRSAGCRMASGSGIGRMRKKKIKFIDHRPSGGKYWRLPLNRKEYPEQLSVALGCGKKYAEQVVAGPRWPGSVRKLFTDAPNLSLEAITPPTNGTVLTRGMRAPPKACKYAGVPYAGSNRKRPKTTDERHHGGYGYVNLEALAWALERFGLVRKAAGAVARDAFYAAFDWSIEYSRYGEDNLTPLEHEKNDGTMAWHYCALSFFTTPTVRHVLEDAGVTGGVVWDWAGHCDGTMMPVYVGY